MRTHEMFKAFLRERLTVAGVSIRHPHKKLKRGEHRLLLLLHKKGSRDYHLWTNPSHPWRAKYSGKTTKPLPEDHTLVTVVVDEIAPGQWVVNELLSGLEYVVPLKEAHGKYYAHLSASHKEFRKWMDANFPKREKISSPTTPTQMGISTARERDVKSVEALLSTVTDQSVRSVLSMALDELAIIAPNQGVQNHV